MSEEHNPSATDQLRSEIHKLLKRYGKESDVTVYQILGLLRVIEFDLVEMLETFRSPESEE